MTWPAAQRSATRTRTAAWSNGTRPVLLWWAPSAGKTFAVGFPAVRRMPVRVTPSTRNRTAMISGAVTTSVPSWPCAANSSGMLSVSSTPYPSARVSQAMPPVARRAASNVGTPESSPFPAPATVKAPAAPRLRPRSSQASRPSELGRSIGARDADQPWLRHQAVARDEAVAPDQALTSDLSLTSDQALTSVWVRSGPTLTMDTGTPTCCSTASR